ncbi:hypothetical protein Dimus_016464 [Dionaea muscipula]
MGFRLSSLPIHLQALTAITNGGHQVPIHLPGYQIERTQRIYSQNLCDEIEATSKAVFIAHGGEETSPLAVSFSKTIKSAHILAMSDEDGHVSLFDTCFELSSSKTCMKNAEKARIANWVAHENVVFDICRIKVG